MLGPNGRNVRCAKCGHRWRQTPPAPIEPLEPETPPAATEPAAMAPGLAALLSGQAAATPRHTTVVVPPKLAPAKPARRVGTWPWVLLAGIVCGLAAAAYFLQGPITKQLPETQSIYAALGLGPEDPAKELEIGNVKSETRSGLVAIRGDIFNPKDTALKIPALKLIAFDADKKALGEPYWFRTQETDIAPGETITFRILYENAPQTMKSVRVTFGKIDAKEH